MCEYVPGEVIFSFGQDEFIAEIMRLWFEDGHAAELGLSLIETLDDVVLAVGVPPEAFVETSMTSWRIGTEPGDELWAANRLRRQYQENVMLVRGPEHSDFKRNLLTVNTSLNYYLSLPSARPGSSAGKPVRVELTPVHEEYKRLLGIEEMPDASTTVAIIDSGITDSVQANVVRRADFIRPRRLGEPVPEDGAVDRYGHGSVVAAIIADVVPSTRLLVYKIADLDAAATEWDLCAALKACGDADVINLSVAFGLERPDCPNCGRRSNSSRSIVMEDILHDLSRTQRNPVIVAAAGNRAAKQLAYPARFGTVVATGSLTRTLMPSSFTDTGATAHNRRTHEGLFFLPGGENKGQMQEYVGRTSGGKTFSGTSFACAYATAIVASRHRPGLSGHTMGYLRAHALHDIPGFDAAVHGNGRLYIGIGDADDGPRGGEDDRPLVW
jgi:subtilisin family serine protease